MYLEGPQRASARVAGPLCVAPRVRGVGGVQASAHKCARLPELIVTGKAADPTQTQVTQRL